MRYQTIAAVLFGISIAGCAEPSNSEDLIAQTAMPLRKSTTTNRLRVLSLNTHLISDLFYVELGGVTGLAGNDSGPECARVLNALAGTDYDVLLLQELFDQNAQSCIVNGLSDRYPYRVGNLQHVDPVDFEEDSGLYIFSRLPFSERFTSDTATAAQVTDFANGTVPFSSRNLYVGKQIFTDSSGIDSMAAKGMLHVEVRNSASEFEYDLMNTHLQAPAADSAVRKNQLRQIALYVADHMPVTEEELDNDDDGPGARILAGDLNIQGYAPAFGNVGVDVLNPLMANSEYGQGIWSKLGDGVNLPFFDVWRATSPAERSATHPGTVAQRLDYFLMLGRGYLQSPSVWAPANPVSWEFNPHAPCPQWVRTTARDSSSDHTGIALELGPHSAHCSPALAAMPNFVSETPVTFWHEGENYWIRLDAPGTYSVGVTEDAEALGVVVDMFPANDLGWKLEPSPLFTERTETLCTKPTPDCKVKMRTYFGGGQPMFARVHAKGGDVTGNFKVRVKKHDCSSYDTRCELKPGLPFVMPSVPGRQTYGHFEARAPSSSFAQANGLAGLWNKFDVQSTGQVLTWVETDKYEQVYWGPGEDAPSIMTSDEGAPVDINVIPPVRSTGYTITWTTNYTTVRSLDGRVVGPPGSEKSLVELECIDETGADGLGSDELGLEMRPDARTGVACYHDDMDATERLPCPATGLGFLNNLEVRVKEYVGGPSGSIDNQSVTNIGPLAPSIQEQLGLALPIQVDGGHYTLRYSLAHSDLP